MYRVLYRKYRPKTFDEVCGQEHITAVLKNEICTGRISHAFLFTGTRGTGKTSCAKILAKAVNCLNSKDGNPCGECANCRGIEDGSVFDVVEIDAASNNGVDNIRELREESNYTPASAKYRVYIIDEVHMLSQGAFNALLKTLEEPPAHVIFILATTEVNKIPATILSRCQRFDFHRISPEDCSKRLKYVASQEGFTLEDEAATLVARLSDGAMRDALSLLDRCVGAENEITVETVTKAAGLADKEYLFSLSDCIINRDAAQALEIINRLHSEACDMERLCDELITHFRNLMVSRTAKNPERLIVCTPAELEKYKQTAAGMTLPAIVSALDVFQNALANIKKGTERRTEVETAFLRLVSPDTQTDMDSVLRRISDLENGMLSRSVRTVNPAAEAKPPVKTVNPAEKTGYREVQNVQSADAYAERKTDSADIPPLDETDRDSADISRNAEAPNHAGDFETDCAREAKNGERIPDGKLFEWPEIVRIINGKNRLIGSQLSGSCAYIKGDYVLIDSQIEQFRDLINNIPECKEAVKSAIASVLGRPYKIGPYKRQAEQNGDKFSEFVNRFKDRFDK